MSRCVGSSSGRVVAPHVEDFRAMIDSSRQVVVHIDKEDGPIQLILPRDALLDIAHQMVSAEQRLQEIDEARAEFPKRKTKEK